MADEILVTASVQIRKDNLQYRSLPNSFKADMIGTAKGPSPGAVSVPTDGKDIYFNELVTPGVCVLTNLDDTNYVEYGIYDPQTSVFYPLGEIQPGETYVLRLSRNLQEQYSGSGTGTTAPENYLRLKANVASCDVFVGAFEA